MSSTAEHAMLWLPECRAVVSKYRANEAHSEKVARLADRLFSAMRELHELDESDREPLVAAALLHDVGHVIGADRHHRHSAYIVAEDPLLDRWDPEFRKIVELLVLNHRKRKRLDMGALDRVMRRRVRRLAAMLRIADVLDREYRQTAEIAEFTFEAANRRADLRVVGVNLEALEPAITRKVGWAASCWEVEFAVAC